MPAADSIAGLWQRYKTTKDPGLRQQLVLQYAPLVKFVVGRMAIGLPGILDSEDIIGHATIGLIDAIERFDPERGLRFETYAIPRIRGSIIDIVRRLGSYPRGARRRVREIEAAMAALEEQIGRMPSDEEVARYLGISPEEYARQLASVGFVTIPMDRTFKANEDDDLVSLADVIEDTTSPSPASEVERAEMREALLRAINELPERDRMVLALYYYEELTLKEISRVLDISESRVCQIHTRAILKLRRALARAGLLTTG